MLMGGIDKLNFLKSFMKVVIATTLIVFLCLGLYYYFYIKTSQTKMIPNKNEYGGFYDDTGKVVTYSGMARDTTDGAALEFQASVSDVYFYLEGMDYWPAEYANQQVIVTGKLVQKKYVMSSKVGEDTVTVQQEGVRYVLEDPQVTK